MAQNLAKGKKQETHARKDMSAKHKKLANQDCMQHDGFMAMQNRVAVVPESVMHLRREMPISNKLNQMELLKVARNE